MPEGTQITADDHGNVTVTYPDKSTDTISGKDLVVKDDQGDHPSTNQSMADQITPNVPGDKVTVADMNQLTKDEKDKVKENVNKANPDLPQGTEVTVGDNGDVTITYPDQATSQGQPAVKAAGSHRPRRQASCHKLGDQAPAWATLSGLGLLFLGLFGWKKKRED